MEHVKLSWFFHKINPTKKHRFGNSFPQTNKQNNSSNVKISTIQPLFIFWNSFNVDVWQGSQHTSVNFPSLHLFLLLCSFSV